MSDTRVGTTNVGRRIASLMLRLCSDFDFDGVSVAVEPDAVCLVLTRGVRPYGEYVSRSLSILAATRASIPLEQVVAMFVSDTVAKLDYILPG